MTFLKKIQIKLFYIQDHNILFRPGGWPFEHYTCQNITFFFLEYAMKNYIVRILNIIFNIVKKNFKYVYLLPLILYIILK